MRYPAYPKYRDSGVEWLGEIPEGWGVRRLKHISTMIIDGTHVTPTYVNDGIPFLRVTDLVKSNGKEIDFDNVKFIPEEEHKEISKRTKPEKGDLLYSKNGTIGVTRIIDWNFDFSIFVSLCLIKIERKIINSSYLSFFLESKVTENQIEFGAKSNTVTNLHLDKIKEFIIAVPLFDEQKTIADFLDKKTSQIDALIEKKKELIEKLKEQRMALITKAVTKGLDDSVPMKDSGVEWLGEIPEGWEVRRLKFVASCNDESLPEDTDYDKAIQYVDISSVSLVEGIKRIEEFTFEKAPSRARRKVRHGDTIISTVRTYLKSIATIKNPTDDMIVSTGFAVIRPNEMINSDFISYFLQNQSFIDNVVARSTGVSYPAINASELICITIVFPLSISEQKAIAEFLNRKISQIDALIKKVEEVIEKLKEYRMTLITDAVIGKIKVG